jgi:hypothetical protein
MIIVLLMIWVADGTSGAIHVVVVYFDGRMQKSGERESACRGPTECSAVLLHLRSSQIEWQWLLRVILHLLMSFVR